MRILVVEDDKRLAGAVRRGLQQEGYAVDVALDGTDGHWLATENSYDALVLDAMLPGMSGEEICRALRERGDWTPLLILTARSGVDEEAAALDAGADDFLAKPFSYVVLLARLRALLRRGAPERPAVLEAGDIRLDPAGREVTRGGDPVPLTPREYTVLEYLLRNPTRVISKSELLDHVWDAAEVTDPNAVEVYVGYLRRKLGRDVIRTVRGVGYRLGT